MNYFKFDEERETEVFINQEGCLVIKQVDLEMCHGNLIIIRGKDRAHEVSQAILKLVESPYFGVVEDEENDDPADPS